MAQHSEYRESDIAIIGMSGRFPGADDVDTFWRNISSGVESFTHFSDEELTEAGVPEEVFRQDNYVRCRPVLDDIRGFDAGFFGYSPREATLADPQQRIFLECTWEALESAGYVTPEDRGTVGVYAGMNISSYLLTRLAAFEMGIDVDGLMIANDKDALATNVAFRLDLAGPALSVQTFCSTSLVSVHIASESLRRGECDMAVAGGVSLRIPDRIGYVYAEGGQASPDGHVRTFDKDARGSMFGDGAAVVVLKRLDAAVADRDTVLAVLRGSAINNDGAMKFSYQAPSIDGQRRCVAAAIERAGVDPNQISYVEAHGTATEVGDPMEVAALTSAFGKTDDSQYCLLGSIKPNVGHLDRASGVTGLIKVIQSLRHELVPGTLNYSSPNKEIDFDASPFYVSAEPVAWPRSEDRPRIAGISSLGMGGTNVHAIVTEAPDAAPRPRRPRRWQVLPVSARSTTAVEQACARLSGYLDSTGDDVDLGDVAYTLQVGRRTFSNRRVVVADSTSGAAQALADPAAQLSRTDGTVGRRAAFLIAGVGEQYPGMVAQLYADEPAFRADVDSCLAILGMSEPGELSDILTPAEKSAAGSDLARMLGRETEAEQSTTDAHLVQPAVFVAEYALARQLIRWGIEPEVMVGYSLGEYVAACVAGVLTLGDALRLVAHRARLIAARPEGAMLAVMADENRLRTVLDDESTRDIDVAVRTGSQLVLAGPTHAIDSAAKLLLDAEIGHRKLDTTHAFHSRMLAPIADELTAWVAENITPRVPEIPYLSNVTGELATEELVTDPGYWARHMCETVEFGAGLEHVLRTGELALVEIGAGQSLGALARAHDACDRAQWPLIVGTLPAANDAKDANVAVAEAVGKLWLTGVDVDWPALHDAPSSTEDSLRWVPGRVPLPTYPFEHQEYWLDVDHTMPLGGQRAVDDSDPMSLMNSLPKLDDTKWINAPVWQQTTQRPARAEAATRWLVYTDGGVADGIAASITEHVTATGGEVVLVRPGERFTSTDDGMTGMTIRPGSPEDTVAMLRSLVERKWEPERVVHLWSLAEQDGKDPHETTAECVLRGVHTLVGHAKASGDLGLTHWALDVITVGSQSVLPGDAVHAQLGTLLGPVRMIPVEYPRTKTRLLDLDVETAAGGHDAVLAELRAEPTDQVVALRSGRRWTPDYQILDASCVDEAAPAAEVRKGGVYLVTGGLGGIGMAMAERLAMQYQARVVLLGRTPVPPREQWNQILAADSTTDEVRRRLEGLQRMESNGIDFTTVAADVSRVEDVRRAVRTAVETYGELNGVLHAAGVPALGLMQFKTAKDIERVLAPKVAGTLAIAEVLRETPVDFLVVFSSTASATGGGPGQVDYCTANAFLDSFALSDPLPGVTVAAVDWCEWTYTGWTIGLDDYDEGSRQYFEWYRSTFGLSFDEGYRTLLRVLASGERHVVVSTQEFPPLVAMSRRSSIESHQATVKKVRDSLGRHPRPELSTPFVEPSTPTEEKIAGVWSEALGLEQVGIHDNFFELGGNSLVGMEIIAEVRQKLELSYLPPHILYQAPTVASLAEAAAEDGAETQEQQEKVGALEQRRSRIEQRRNTLRRRTS